MTKRLRSLFRAQRGISGFAAAPRKDSISDFLSNLLKNFQIETMGCPESSKRRAL